MFRAIVFVTFAAATVLTGAARAQMPATSPQKQIAVNYADLDIGHRAGAVELIGRMHAAAAQACGPAPDIRQLQLSQAYRQCISDAVARGVADVNVPIVTELFRGTANPVLAVAAR